jgi:hypothetical protein
LTFTPASLEVVGKAKVEETVVSHQVVEIRRVDAKECDDLRTQGPLAEKTPIKFER